ncbi:MAG: class I SAM-dependent methyltransferase [Bacilli bacterium]|nr:class I SAM-dependent methyltransferase [Bacilli bacterium]
MKLSKRLKALANCVPHQAKVIDIGCDHGLLGIYLVKNKLVSNMIISDISEAALNQAKRNITKYNLINKIKVQQGDGLAVIDYDCNIDTIIIAGLGGQTIIDILTKNQSFLLPIKNIILQPQNNVYCVRQKITKLGYFISYEELIKENEHIYTLIVFNKGKQRYSYYKLYFGPYLLQHQSQLFNELYQHKLDKIKKICKQIPPRYLFKKLWLLRKIIMIKRTLSSHK